MFYTLGILWPVYDNHGGNEGKWRNHLLYSDQKSLTCEPALFLFLPF